MVEYITANWETILVILFALEQLLAANPNIKANSTFQLVSNILNAFTAKKVKVEDREID